MTVANAPWWGIPALSGAVAFLGVLLAQGVALWIDRRRRINETQRRWDRERQSTYVAFIAAVYECLDANSASHVRPSKELVVADSSIQLLASRPVADCARQIVALIARNPTTCDEDLPAKARRAMDNFNSAVRLELGILAPRRRVVVVAGSVPELLSRALVEAARATVRAFRRKRLKNEPEDVTAALQEGGDVQ